jgi:hypothetical protein
MGDTGPEDIQKSPEKTSISLPGGAESGALPDALREIVTIWPRLSGTVQAVIVSIIRGTARGNAK